MGNKITVVVQTRNEASHISDCITSAQLLTKDIVVVDMESSDQTVSLATRAGVRVTSFPYSNYVEPARQFGVEQATGDWVFILDADERITPELVEEIHACLSKTTFTHFKIPRKNIFGNKYWLQHGGWWPDHQMRLIQKKAFQTWPARIHATPIISGQMGLLKQPIYHLFHGDISKMVEKTIQFEDIESDLLFKANRAVSTAVFFRKYVGELNRRLFVHAGFKDGRIGILEAVYQAFSKTITWLYLYEKKKSRPV